MRSPFVNLLVRPGFTVTAPVVAACLLVAGCGGSGHAQTFPGGVKPIGPSDLTANVTGLMAHSQSQLKHVKARCPRGPVTGFPVLCRFTATQVAPLPGSSAKVKKNFTGPYRVAGTIKVIGVYYRTRTYEYILDYAPVH